MEVHAFEVDTSKTPTEVKLHSNLRALVDAYEQAQKNRVAWSNRVAALKQGRDEASSPVLLQAQQYVDAFEAIEDQALKNIKVELKNYPVYCNWMKNVCGIGPTLAGKLLCQVDISKAPHASSLWAFAGLGLKNGERQRLRTGEKASYCTRLKATCFLTARQFIMGRSKYAEVYYSAKAYYQANRPGWTPGHIDLAARRKMVKLFMAHLWVKWREEAGLSVSKPYVEEKLGHTHISSPDDYLGKMEVKAA